MTVPATAQPPQDAPGPASAHGPRIGEQLERWAASGSDRSIGGLVDLAGEKSFAILFVVLLGVPALPLPTGGATHVFEVMCVLLAAQMIIGRRVVWLPQRWRAVRLDGKRSGAFLERLISVVRRIERLSRPRLRWLFGRRASDIVFGILIIAFSVAAFVAPPFSGLDTGPALGGVLLSLAVLLEDVLVAVVALVLGAVGIALEIVLGAAAVKGVEALL